ncbi:hypothetical protein ABE288_06740 [Bacillus salipaludis]|uniref:hypothetical protein n=1 Tax=Bacillus salipaludis TaxID=2547811 RepID=UPI003D1FC7F9
MFWIMVVLLIVLIIIFEEAASYFWRQYLYGPSNKSQRKWKKWMMKALTFIRKKPQMEIREMKKEESS